MYAILQQLLRDITHPDDLRLILEHNEQLLSGQIGAFMLDQRYQRKDTTAFWAKLSVTPVRGDDGAIEALVAIITDITEHKETDATLQRALVAPEARRGDGREEGEPHG